jgi:hypothetical protein
MMSDPKNVPEFFHLDDPDNFSARPGKLLRTTIRYLFIVRAGGVTPRRIQT